MNVFQFHATMQLSTMYENSSTPFIDIMYSCAAIATKTKSACGILTCFEHVKLKIVLLIFVNKVAMSSHMNTN